MLVTFVANLTCCQLSSMALKHTLCWASYSILVLLRNRSVQQALTEVPLQSFIAPTTSIYSLWSHTETTDTEDKAFIEERITSSFPNGFEGFNHVMQQANGTAALSAIESNPWYPPAALDSLAAAAEYWFQRSGKVS